MVVWSEGVLKCIDSAKPHQSGVAELPLNPRAAEPHRTPIQAFSSVAGMDKSAYDNALHRGTIGVGI
jgi:hypothetical protein